VSRRHLEAAGPAFICRRWSWGLGLAIAASGMFGACSGPAASFPSHSSRPGTISGSIHLGRSPGKVVAIPRASVTMRSQAGELVTARATSEGLFDVKVPPGIWTVQSIAPSALNEFCANPRSIHVVSAHVETVDVQVACVSTGGGGGFFVPKG
jgi:hypothetical protein